MSEDLLSYLLKELRDHVTELMEVATSDAYSPQDQYNRLEYHSSKATEIIDRLSEGAALTSGKH